MMSAPKYEKFALDQHPSYTYHHENDHSTYKSMPSPPSRGRRVLVLVLTVVLPFYLLVQFFGLSTSETTVKSTADDVALRHPHSPGLQVTIDPHSDRAPLVPLEVHIMSKCPDARDCLRDLVVPAMEKISDQVDFRLSFIGRYVHLLVSGPRWISSQVAAASFPTSSIDLHAVPVFRSQFRS